MVDLNQWWRMPGNTSTAMDLVAVRRIADELAAIAAAGLDDEVLANAPRRPTAAEIGAILAAPA